MSEAGWGEPHGLGRYHSPYYTAGHLEWRDKVRAFVEAELEPHVAEWEKQKEVPHAVFRKVYEAGILPAIIGAPWVEQYSGPCPVAGGAAAFDAFHELIVWQEFARLGSGGLLWGIFEGLQIGVPPLLNFADKQLCERVAPDCLQGKKVICLCISEPYAGSDVANIRSTAVRKTVTNPATGRQEEVFVLNGEKKWITNGFYADYFVVATRTGGPGKNGISLLVVDGKSAGLERQRMQCSGMWASGTSFITFSDVHVPVANLVGKENQGFKYIMYNFNHERWGFIAQAVSFARVCLDDATQYALRRRTFGKKLAEHPVIRWKLGEMARQVESTQAMLEVLTYQMCKMGKQEQMTKLASDSALIKVQATKVFEYCAREAAQIFGGNSYIMGGQGERVERLYREVRALAIPGGSEEIMLDLGVRQALRPAAKL